MEIDTFHEVWTLLDIVHKAATAGPQYAWFGQQAYIELLKIKETETSAVAPPPPPPNAEYKLGDVEPPPRAIPSARRESYEGLPGPAEGPEK